MSTKWADNNPRMLELWAGSNKPVIPGSHGPPATDVEFVITGCHWDYCSTIAIDVVPAIVIDLPHFHNDSGPSSYILSNVMNIERVLNCSNPIIRLSFECFKLSAAWHMLPVLTLHHLHLHVEWRLLRFVDIDDWFYASADMQLWAFECRHIQIFILILLSLQSSHTYRQFNTLCISEAWVFILNQSVYFFWLRLKKTGSDFLSEISPFFRSKFNAISSYLFFYWV